MIRNIGSSVGISIVIAQLTSKTTLFHSQLIESVTPFNQALPIRARRPMLDLHGIGARHAGKLVTRQATIIAYANDFKLMMWISLAAFPLLLLIKGPKKGKR